MPCTVLPFHRHNQDLEAALAVANSACKLTTWESDTDNWKERERERERESESIIQQRIFDDTRKGEAFYNLHQKLYTGCMHPKRVHYAIVSRVLLRRITFTKDGTYSLPTTVFFYFPLHTHSTDTSPV